MEQLWAAYSGHKEVVQLLLDKGAEINMATQTGRTPLHWAVCAAFRGHKDVVQLLLDRGAQPNMADQTGATPLSYAFKNNGMDIANILTENGGTV